MKSMDNKKVGDRLKAAAFLSGGDTTVPLSSAKLDVKRGMSEWYIIRVVTAVVLTVFRILKKLVRRLFKLLGLTAWYSLVSSLAAVLLTILIIAFFVGGMLLISVIHGALSYKG
jgi:hypothetical protein